MKNHHRLDGMLRGAEMDSGMRERGEERQRRGEEREVSGRARAPRGPRRSLYISGLPSPLTRQAVSATFSRSVASASCQRKQRARFVKPKVKLRSNEGTVPPRRHLRHHPATGARQRKGEGGQRGLNAKRRSRSRSESRRDETRRAERQNSQRSKQPRGSKGVWVTRMPRV